MTASERFRDGLTLAGKGRRTGAIYLWGYAVEMVVKAAFFQAKGFDVDHPITKADLEKARKDAMALGISWPGNLHYVPAWAELLVATRTASSAFKYPSATFASEMVSCAGRLHSVWREILRYHKNVAYLHEVSRVRTAAEWFLANSLAI